MQLNQRYDLEPDNIVVVLSQCRYSLFNGGELIHTFTSPNLFSREMFLEICEKLSTDPALRDLGDKLVVDWLGESTIIMLYKQ